MTTCGNDTIEKTKEGRLMCVVCKNIGGTGAIMHLNYDGTYKKGPDGETLYSYLQKDGTFGYNNPLKMFSLVYVVDSRETTIMVFSFSRRKVPDILNTFNISNTSNISGG